MPNNRVPVTLPADDPLLQEFRDFLAFASMPKGLPQNDGRGTRKDWNSNNLPAHDRQNSSPIGLLFPCAVRMTKKRRFFSFRSSNLPMSCFHPSIEGAQHGAKSLSDFLAYAKRSGAAGA